ncbi:hypothetical protein CLOSTHATH_04898, partial [Hungatella hathewayi DSM 13479]
VLVCGFAGRIKKVLTAVKRLLIAPVLYGMVSYCYKNNRRVP